ncbi:MAG: hypothetical protein IJ506_04710 [Clostridia bacterium]|nr:hypothetical protein [Clostridia bacterium]
MSDAEKKKRAEYKKKRKRWLIVQAVVLVVIAIAIAVSSVVYSRLTETVYITYAEQSAVNYKVKYEESEFYDDVWQDSDQAYVVSLIESVAADFSYGLSMDSKNVNYEYTYGIDAQLKIVDNATKKAIFAPIYTLKEAQTAQSASNKLVINEHVDINYVEYNELAEKFVDTYGLNDATATLTVKMNITVVGSCKDFKDKSRNDYVVSLNIPVAVKTMEIQMTSTVPTGKNRVLACDSGFDKEAFKTAIIVISVVEGALLIGFAAFVFLTRNEDINYSIKVKKLVANYRSYVQKINNGFDTAGYQLLAVDSFGEMLAIRDTIQSPILMSENKDQTRTVFFIPTNTKILYTYEIKVENYDELYKEADDTAGSEIFKDETSVATEKEKAAEEVSIAKATEKEEKAETAETVVQEVVQEPTQTTENTENAESEQIAEEIAPSEDEGERGYNFGPRMDYSFEARLTLAEEEIKDYYKQVVDFVRSYGNVKISRSWKRERIYKGRKLFAALSFRANKLVIALALDPTTADAKYHAKDVTGMKRYEGTPMLMRITSTRKAKYAIELLTALFEREGLTNGNLKVKPTTIAKKSKTALLKNNLIKIESA